MPKRTVAHAPHVVVQVEDMSVDRLPGSPGPETPAAWEDRGAGARARESSKARSASTRRRRVDPTTCDLEYSQAQLEFMLAMQDYKQSSGRMYPTWSEVLEVLQGLGYEKASPGPDPQPPRPRDE